MTDGWVLASMAVDAVLLAVLLWRKHRNQKRIVYMVFYALEFTAFSAVINRIFQSVSSGLEATIGTNPGFPIVGFICAQALVTATAILLLMLKTRRKDATFDLREKLLSALYVIGLAVCISPGASAIWALVQSLFILLLFIGVSILYEKAIQNEGILKEKEEQTGRKTAETAYLKNIEDNYRRTREIWHDLNHHIGCMNMLLAEKKYNELDEYLDGFSEKVQSSMLPVRTGNIVMDAVLGDKYNIARKSGISMEFDLTSLGGFWIEATDLCAILGNLLDNAIEECNKHKRQQEKWIRILTRVAGTNSVLFSVSNPVLETPQRINGVPQTMKPDVSLHGFGIRSIRRIADKYSGEVIWNCDDDIFTISVRLNQSPGN